MKKTTTAIIVFAAALLTLTSCGNREKSSRGDSGVREIVTGTQAVSTESASAETTTVATEPTTVPDYHERHDYEDGVLVGSWTGDYVNIDLKDDGKVALHNDISEILMFTNEKGLMFNGVEYSAESVKYDGTNLKVEIADDTGEIVTLLDAKRNDEPNTDKLDGEYSFNGGYLIESLVEAAEEEEKILPDITMNIRHGHCFITINNFCTYTQKGDTIEFTDCTVDPALMDSEFGSSTFVLDDDGGFTLYDTDGNTEKFEKAAE